MINCSNCDKKIDRNVFCCRQCKDAFHNTKGVKKEVKDDKSTLKVLNGINMDKDYFLKLINKG